MPDDLACFAIPDHAGADQTWRAGLLSAAAPRPARHAVFHVQVSDDDERAGWKRQPATR